MAMDMEFPNTLDHFKVYLLLYPNLETLFPQKAHIHFNILHLKSKSERSFLIALCNLINTDSCTSHTEKHVTTVSFVVLPHNGD